MNVVRKRLAMLVLFAALASCKTQQNMEVYTPSVLPQHEPPPEAPPPVVQDDAQLQKQRMLVDILYEAKKAYDENRLMQPAGRNAYEMYDEVLHLDPGNRIALDGIQEIATRYISMADAAIGQLALENAEGYLARAARLSPEHPQLAASRARLEDAKKGRLQVHALNPAGVSAKNAETVKELGAIAHQLQTSNATFLIRARSDDEGRWIYKVMRDAVGGYRLRGNIDIAPAPAIVITPPAPETKPAAESKPATKSRKN
ncbi:MAG TPA: hypothetical protein VMH83_15710 [Candidatus Acidoferrum sp.]|nr:hypothetical protein [Candidatus Acidoferrum sp.]